MSIKYSSFIYIDLEDVLFFHEVQLKEHGGQSGVRSQEGLESAIFQPQVTFGGDDLYPDVFTKAAAYCFFLAQSQAFVDGNKRAALMAGLTFLSVNGFRIESDHKMLYECMIGFADKTKDLKDMADLLKEFSIPAEDI